MGSTPLRDLPDFEALEDAGLLSKEKRLAGDVLAGMVGDGESDEEEELEANIDEHQASQAGAGALDGR